MSRIGLVDIDGHNFPNFALMRISAFHKNQGDQVEWADPMFGEGYDKVYMSKIFTFTPDYPYGFDCDVIKGGTGYDVKSHLPLEIESSPAMDYSIYPNCNYSLQFFSRGCIRKCPFCLVRDKEGYIHPVDPVDLNPNGEWIEVLDNNFFANPEWKEAVDYLIRGGCLILSLRFRKTTSLLNTSLNLSSESGLKKKSSVGICTEIKERNSLPGRWCREKTE